MKHAFEVRIASAVGIEKAILIECIAHWLKVNAEKKDNYHNFKDGRIWMYNPTRKFQEIYPYIGSRSTLSRMLNELESDRYIITGCYNRMKQDRTKWYTFHDGFLNSRLFKRSYPELAKVLRGLYAIKAA